MGSGSKRSKASTVAMQHDDDELLVAKGSLLSARSASPEVLLQVNEKFARSFEERKRKEELSTLEKRGLNANDDDGDDDESESETEDEDGEELTRELDVEISKTLKLIRKKDPAIYNSSITFFKQPETSQLSDEDADVGGKKKTKNVAPLYYKDMVRQQAIAGDDSGSDDDDDDVSPMDACPLCGHLIPLFALSAHERFHRLAEAEAEAESGSRGAS